MLRSPKGPLLEGPCENNCRYLASSAHLVFKVTSPLRVSHIDFVEFLWFTESEVAKN